jgi:hypothetical protein
MFDAADIAAFFSEDMPGYAIATFAVGGVTVPGLFSNGYGMAIEIGGSSPSFVCPAASVTAFGAGSALSVAGTNYVIAGPIESNYSTGRATLRLRDA